jgi:hypothetical protein
VRELASCQAIHVARIDPVVVYRVKAGVKAGQRTCSAQRAEQGKQALARYCRVSSRCWHLTTGLGSTGSISRGTRQGRPACPSLRQRKLCANGDIAVCHSSPSPSPL